MTVMLDPAIVDVGRALGLLDPGGNIDTTWFDHAGDRFKTIFTAPDQRSALLDALDSLIPPDGSIGSSDEKWHPLLTEGIGTVYLVVRSLANGSAVLGLAGAVRSATSTTPSIDARLELPLVRFDSSGMNRVIGTSPDGAITLAVDANLGWTTPADAFTVQRLSLAIEAMPADSPAAAKVRLDAKGLGTPAGVIDVSFDPARPDPSVADLLLPLISQLFTRLLAAAGLPPDATMLVAHLASVLGLDSPSPIPIGRIASDRGALRAWLLGMLGDPSRRKAWLDAIASLVGAVDSHNAPFITGDGTSGDPYSIAVTPSSGPAFELLLSVGTDGAGGLATLDVGIRVSATTSAAPVIVEGEATIVRLPLSGAAQPTVLPEAHVGVRSKGSGASQKLLNTSSLSIDELQAGVTWSANRLAPHCILRNVDANFTAGGTTIALSRDVDLADASSVAAAGSAVTGALGTALASALGSSTVASAGAHLAALAGLIPPAADPTLPTVDLATLVQNPLGAIAAVHRQSLASAVGWGAMMRELAGLVAAAGGTAPTVLGTGTPDDPWRVAIVRTSTVGVELAAWVPAGATNVITLGPRTRATQFGALERRDRGRAVDGECDHDADGNGDGRAWGEGRPRRVSAHHSRRGRRLDRRRKHRSGGTLAVREAGDVGCRCDQSPSHRRRRSGHHSQTGVSRIGVRSRASRRRHHARRDEPRLAPAGAAGARSRALGTLDRPGPVDAARARRSRHSHSRFGDRRRRSPGRFSHCSIVTAH